MTAGELIAALSKYKREDTFEFTIKKPHSYRGSYEKLAFEVDWQQSTVGDVIDKLKEAIGHHYMGYKGGEYYMSMDSDVYLSQYGCCGEEFGLMIIKLAVTEIE